MRYMGVATADGGGAEHRIVNRFLRGFGDRLKERPKSVMAEQGDFSCPCGAVVGNAYRLGHREGNEVVSASGLESRAGAGHPCKRSPGEALELTDIERGVSCHDDHAGAAAELAHVRVQILVIVTTELLADRNAVDSQDAGEVRLHQHAHGVAANRLGQEARGGSNAPLDLPLKAEGRSAGAGPDRSFFDRAGGG